MAEFEPLASPVITFESEADCRLQFSAFGGDLGGFAGGYVELVLEVDAETSVGGAAALRFEAFGGDFSGMAGGWASLAFRGDGVAGGFLPDAAFGAGNLAFEASATPFYINFGGGEGDLGYSAFGGDFGSGAGGWGELTLSARGGPDEIYEQNPLVLLLTPGFMYATIGYGLFAGADGIVFSGAATDALTWTAEDVLQLSALASTHMAASNSVNETIAFRDTPALVTYLAAVSAVTFADSAEASLYALLAAASMMQLDDSIETTMRSYGVAASMFVMADAGVMRGELAAIDAFEMSDEAVDSVRTLVAALDTLTLADESAGNLYAFGSATDTLTLEDATSGLLSGALEAFDTITFSGIIRLLGVDYTAYSVSLDNQAVSEYENYNFGSFAVHEASGVVFGMGDDGIYSLDGPTDNGEPIVGRVRGGLNNLGTALKKAVPAVYVGYTSTNKLGLKVITTDGPSGEKRANIYSLQPIAKAATTDGRFSPSKKLHSVYWQFELLSEEGGQFELDEVRMWRMVLNRRK